MCAARQQEVKDALLADVRGKLTDAESLEHQAVQQLRARDEALSTSADHLTAVQETLTATKELLAARDQALAEAAQQLQTREQAVLDLQQQAEAKALEVEAAQLAVAELDRVLAVCKEEREIQDRQSAERTEEREAAESRLRQQLLLARAALLSWSCTGDAYCDEGVACCTRPGSC
eukprot:TRINITY_DN316_c0_g1_i14.p1 TRINITY_DN316_c0_g1~~TRINITY_DN316_c0_g1_i14.p1  ORF type:complete len:176 (+),score=27.81 TRINITY_DN316_c0_g1_i14:396-923(+)